MNTAADGSFHPFPQQSGRVFALGLTYADHIRETGEKAGKPAIFMKQCQPDLQPESVATPAAATLLDSITRLDSGLAGWLRQQFAELPALLDYEVELGLVLLDDCSAADLAQGRVPQVGFFLANDVTARSVQIAGQGSASRMDFWAASKSLPGFLPVSKQYWLPVGGLPVSWPALTLRTLVNGVARQNAPTSNLIYSPLEMLRLALQEAPQQKLHRHDLILTGTPAGVALSVPRWKRLLGTVLPRRTVIAKAIAGNIDNPKFLRPGDTVEVSADWLGRFATTIR